jgi:hypothetical protein
MITSAIDNAKQVVLDGYVCSIQDGENVHLFWAVNGVEVSEKIGNEIVKLIADEDAVFTDECVGHGLYRLELVETDEQLVDCN